MGLALMDGVVDEEGLEEIAGDVADAVAGDVVDEELDFFEAGESAAVVVGDGVEEVEDLLGGSLPDAAAFAGVGVAETDFVALAERAEDGDGFFVFTLLLQVAEVVEGVDQCGVERVVLLRGESARGGRGRGRAGCPRREMGWRSPLWPGHEDTVMVGEAWADEGHGVIVSVRDSRFQSFKESGYGDWEFFPPFHATLGRSISPGRGAAMPRREGNVEGRLVTLHMVSSLDGFIARKDNSVSWLENGSVYEAGVSISEEEGRGLRESHRLLCARFPHL